MRKTLLKSIFRIDTISPIDSWNTFRVYLLDRKLSSSHYFVDGSRVSFEKVGSVLLKSASLACYIEDEYFEFLHGVVRNNQYCFVYIKSKQPIDLDWEPLVFALKDQGVMISAWVDDSEYAFWQNAEDLLQYRAAGRSYEGLPMKSNGLPFPVERQIIDISGNPGRWLHRSGYVEAVASRMWFGDSFWNLTGANPVAIRQLEFVEDGLSRLVVQNSCFSSATGAEGAKQNELRALLYPSVG